MTRYIASLSGIPLMSLGHIRGIPDHSWPARVWGPARQPGAADALADGGQSLGQIRVEDGYVVVAVVVQDRLLHKDVAQARRVRREGGLEC
jgi:hypothetical protein